MSEQVTLNDYLANGFTKAATDEMPELPLKDESHVEDWAEWHPEGPLSLKKLAERLPQLLFGVAEGVGKTEGYRKATLSNDRMLCPDPDSVREGHVDYSIERHWAGSLPAIRVRNRDDFEWLFRILGFKGEPGEISPQAHALLVAGLPDPTRIESTKQAWIGGKFKDDPLVGNCSTWGEAMSLLDRTDRTRFRTRILMLHGSTYAGLSHEAVSCADTHEEWLAQSNIIRLEHEFAHYASRRLYENMRLNLHDEILADCMGITAAIGRFDAQLFLDALGIRSGELPAPQARAWTYLPKLPEKDVITACTLTASAAINLERWVDEHGITSRPHLLQMIARTSLADLADPEIVKSLHCQSISS